MQGVGFRWWTTRTAEALGLRGTVRNRPDGAVEIVAAGSAEALRTFRSRLEEGPSGARVEKVRTVPSADPPPELGTDLRIVR